MPITLVTGPANSGKAEVVMDAVRRELAHGSEPLLIVPTSADVEHYRRELTGRGAAIGVAVERFEGLIGEAVRRAGVCEPVLTPLARERVLAAVAVRGAAAEIAPASTRALAGEDGTSGAAIAGPGLVRALGEFVAEQQVRRVTPQRLRAALQRWAAVDGVGAQAAELAALFDAYCRSLRSVGRIDREQQAVLALDALRRGPARWGGRPVLFYGFDDLTRLQLDAIETLGVVVDASVTVSLAYEPGRSAFAGRAGTFQTLLPLAAEHRKLPARADYYARAARPALSHLERSLFEPEAPRMDSGGYVRVLAGADERAELELVAAKIGALLEQGVEPAEIAVVMRTPSQAADLLRDVFGAAGIPHAVQRRTSFADTATGRALVGLLRCAAPGGEARAGDLLAWLRAPGLLDHPRLADRLEANVRRAGACSAEQARAIWEQRHWPLEAIDSLRAAAEQGPVALIERAARELERLFAAPRRGQASLPASHELDEGRALAAGHRALGELRELALLDAELAPGDGAALARVLAGLELVSPSAPGPDAVAVLDPLALRARRVKALFVCRLQEGVFPAFAAPSPLVAEEDRRRIAETSGLSLGEREDALAAERFLFYAATTRPEQLLVLSWHATGEDGTPQARSLFVDYVCDLFADVVQRDPAPARVAEPLRERSQEPGIAPLRDERLLAELRAHTWSASSLEVWMSCPVRWLVERLLRAHDLDPDPEPLARGGLAHAALRDTFEGLRSRTGSARLAPERLGLARELLREALAKHAPEFPLSAAAERRPVLRRRLQADLERYLQHASDTVAALEPTHLEWEFGFAADDRSGSRQALPAFDLGGGVKLRGRVDRVDVGDAGEAVVYDYKGAGAPPAAKWIAAGNLQVALYMASIESLLGLRAVGGFYQPLTGRDLRARGVLDVDGGVELGSVGSDARGGPDVRTLLCEAAALAREAAAQAGRGELEARPQTCAFAGGCMYPSICRCEC